MTMVTSALHALATPDDPLARRGTVWEATAHAWCEAIGETEALFLEPDAAHSAGYPATVAPPAMLQSWCANSSTPSLHAAVRQVMRDAGLTAVVATDYEIDVDAPFVVGDTVQERAWVEHVSTWKQTPIGEGHFVTIRFALATQRLGDAATLAARTFYFTPAPAEPRTTAQAADPFSEVSTALDTTWSVPVTRRLVMDGARTSGDHEPVHHDGNVARAQGLPDVITSIVTTTGLVCRYAAQLTGSNVLTPHLRLRLAAPAIPGDTLTFAARGPSTGPRHIVVSHERGRHATVELGRPAA